MTDPGQYDTLQKRVTELEKEVEGLKRAFYRLAGNLPATEQKTEQASENQPVVKKNVFFPEPAPIARKTLLERFGIKDSLEVFLGGNLLGKSGLLAIILATLWFIKYAFDNYWINESGRIFIGLSLGMAVITGGNFLAHRRYRIVPEAILGSGYAILYISISSAYYFYDLITATETFLYLVALSVFTGILSAKSQRQVLYAFSFLGSLLAPIILSHGENSYRILFSYLTLTNLLFIYISRSTAWQVAPFLVFLGNAVLFSGWADANLKQSGFWLPFCYLILTYSLLLYREVQLMPTNQGMFSRMSFLLVLLYTFSFGVSGYALVFHHYSAWTGHFFLLIAGLLSLTSAQLNRNRHLAGAHFLQPVLFILWIMAFFTAITDFSNGKWTSLFWIGLAGSISYLAASKRLFWLTYTSIILWLIALVRLYFHESELDYNYYFMFNPRFGLFVFASALLFLSYYVQRNQLLTKFMRLFIFLGLFTLILGSMIENYYLVSDPFYRNLGYSYVLVIYMLLTLVPGFVKNYRSFRLSGIVLSVLLVLKLYLYDIWNMGLIVKIIAGFSLGVGLVILSIVYQKYINQIQDKKE